jgi:hypothetical protein
METRAEEGGSWVSNLTDCQQMKIEAGGYSPVVREPSERFNRFLKLLDHFWIKAIAGIQSFHFSLNQTCLLQTLQMLAHRGLSQGQYFNNLATHAFIDFPKIVYYLDPGRVA